MKTKPKWTTRVPTVAGYYWNAELDMSIPYCCFWDEADLTTIAREGTLWFGPVRPPAPNKRKKTKGK